MVWKIHDIEMLFEQGEYVGVRKQGDPSSVLPGWSRSFRKLELSVNDVLSKQLKTSKDLISCLFNGQIKGSICATLIRAIEWIGESITREEFDDKIVDLCMALETLLATKQDKSKRGKGLGVAAIALCFIAIIVGIIRLNIGGGIF